MKARGTGGACPCPRRRRPTASWPWKCTVTCSAGPGVCPRDTGQARSPPEEGSPSKFPPSRQGHWFLERCGRRWQGGVPPRAGSGDATRCLQKSRPGTGRAGPQCASPSSLRCRDLTTERKVRQNTRERGVISSVTDRSHVPNLRWAAAPGTGWYNSPLPLA